MVSFPKKQKHTFHWGMNLITSTFIRRQRLAQLCFVCGCQRCAAEDLSRRIRCPSSCGGFCCRETWGFREAIHCSEIDGGFLKWWVSPTNPWGFPTKNDQHLGCEMGVPTFTETPRWLFQLWMDFFRNLLPWKKWFGNHRVHPFWRFFLQCLDLEFYRSMLSATRWPHLFHCLWATPSRDSRCEILEMRHVQGEQVAWESPFFTG